MIFYTRSLIFLFTNLAIYLYKNILLFFAAGGVRKVTTGITGLWRRSVQSDAAFWFFDVGSSYPTLASGRKGTFVHRYKGTWAGFRPSRDRLVLSYCCQFSKYIKLSTLFSLYIFYIYIIYIEKKKTKIFFI